LAQATKKGTLSIAMGYFFILVGFLLMIMLAPFMKPDGEADRKNDDDYLQKKFFDLMPEAMLIAGPDFINFFCMLDNFLFCHMFAEYSGIR
jgi:hypothetical protein